MVGLGAGCLGNSFLKAGLDGTGTDGIETGPDGAEVVVLGPGGALGQDWWILVSSLAASEELSSQQPEIPSSSTSHWLSSQPPDCDRLESAGEKLQV